VLILYEYKKIMGQLVQVLGEDLRKKVSIREIETLISFHWLI